MSCWLQYCITEWPILCQVGCNTLAQSIMWPGMMALLNETRFVSFCILL